MSWQQHRGEGGWDQRLGHQTRAEFFGQRTELLNANPEPPCCSETSSPGQPISHICRHTPRSNPGSVQRNARRAADRPCAGRSRRAVANHAQAFAPVFHPFPPSLDQSLPGARDGSRQPATICIIQPGIITSPRPKGGNDERQRHSTDTNGDRLGTGTRGTPPASGAGPRNRRQGACRTPT